MSEYPWTPGPWRSNDGIAGDGYSIDSDGSQVGFVFCDPDGTEDPRRAEADAALVALAPEMAEAILAACEVNDDGDGILSSNPVRDVLDDLRERIESIGK